MTTALTRVAVLYDGAYFKQGQIYYRYNLDLGWISFPEFHAYLLELLKQQEGADYSPHKVVVVDYYDGRASSDYVEPEQLSKERDFELVLTKAGIKTHYLPVRERENRGMQESRFEQKGVEARIILDTSTAAARNEFDVLVFVTGNDVYTPLIRSIQKQGKPVLLVHFRIDSWADPRIPGYPDVQGSRSRYRHSTSCGRDIKNEAMWEVELISAIKASQPNIFLSPRKRLADIAAE